VSVPDCVSWGTFPTTLNANAIINIF
jgi:hypothetical protein